MSLFVIFGDTSFLYVVTGDISPAVPHLMIALTRP